jgi:uncharacterized lipoprotein YmbA
MSRAAGIFFIVGLCGSVVACGSFAAKPDPSRFFVLSAISVAAGVKEAPEEKQAVLGVGPVRFPGYLDRQEIITRSGQNRFIMSEHDRWAEPLEENFTRVLAQNLAGHLGIDRIVLYPWTAYSRPPRFVTVEVLSFETDGNHEAHLAARWSMVDTGSKKPLIVKVSRLVRQAERSSTEASVAALSELVGDLSREIAGTVGAVGAIDPRN